MGGRLMRLERICNDGQGRLFSEGKAGKGKTMAVEFVGYAFFEIMGQRLFVVVAFA